MEASMFGIDFYPTPPALVKRMMKDLELCEVGAILEPSAGKGDIIKAIRKEDNPYGYRNRRVLDIDAIEIDPALRGVLSSDDTRVVHDDFLSYHTFKKYGLIIMNPPFSDGDRHLLKAIELQRHGGRIRCLLNAETLRNPFSNGRQLLARKLGELGATVEYWDNAFATAERRTDVDVAFVSIDIPHSDGESVILDDLRKAQDMEATAWTPGQLVSADPLEAMVAQYNFEAKAGLSLIREFRKLAPHILNKIGEENAEPILKVCMGRYRDMEDATENGYIAALRDKYWRALLANRNFTGILTSELQDRYMKQIETLRDYEFTLYNIYSVRAQFNDLALAGVNKAILDLFEALSYQNSYHGGEMEKNVHYFNGWKTNKAWIVNKKVIRTGFGIEDDYHHGFRFHYYSKGMQELLDMEKVFSYLEGKPFEREGQIARIVEQAFKDGQNRGIDTEYFVLTFFKKGTCHVTFKNDDLLKKFNLYGSMKRAWLPPSYGRAAYEDMSPEERAVVDEFEGEASYSDTVKRANFFIVGSPEKLLAAAA